MLTLVYNFINYYEAVIKREKRKASMFKSVICNNDIENLNLNYILNKRVTDMDFFIQRKKNVNSN